MDSAQPQPQHELDVSNVPGAVHSICKRSNPQRILAGPASGRLRTLVPTPTLMPFTRSSAGAAHLSVGENPALDNAKYVQRVLGTTLANRKHVFRSESFMLC